MWSEQQLAALEALGIPVYELGPKKLGSLSRFSGTLIEAPKEVVPDAGLSSALDKVPEEVLTDPNFSKPVRYRLGPWYLVFPSDIPAESFDWLRDLSSFIGGRPVQVSHTPADKVVIDCSAYAKNQLGPEQKQALWAELKPALS